MASAWRKPRGVAVCTHHGVRWQDRFLTKLFDDKPKAPSGIAEGDATFIL